MSSTTISVRVDESLKRDTDYVFQQLGLTTSQAIKLFLNQVRLRHSLPFALELPDKIPNAETVAALEEKIEDMEVFENIDEYFKAMDLE